MSLTEAVNGWICVSRVTVMQEMRAWLLMQLSSKRKMLILVNIQQKVIQTSYGRGATGEYVYMLQNVSLREVSVDIHSILKVTILQSASLSLITT
jgi:hypothetical protein